MENIVGNPEIIMLMGRVDSVIASSMENRVGNPEISILIGSFTHRK